MTTSLQGQLPPFALTYWRPWHEEPNLTDSYLNYVRDVSLATYAADTVGQYVQAASGEQVAAIRALGLDIAGGLDVISAELGGIAHQLSGVAMELQAVNRHLDLQLQQQKVSNLLLGDIAQLLRLPDSEKERQRAIEIGMKFFVAAARDPDLYTDALAHLLRAEEIVEQDYFVLHHIGLIYLFAAPCLDVASALQYFTRAARYAQADAVPEARRLTSVLFRGEAASPEAPADGAAEARKAVAESYDRAAFAAYVLGDVAQAVALQRKAVGAHAASAYLFSFAKYLARGAAGAESAAALRDAIKGTPALATAALGDLDLMNEPAVIAALRERHAALDAAIAQVRSALMALPSARAMGEAAKLAPAAADPYEVKWGRWEAGTAVRASVEQALSTLHADCAGLLDAMRTTLYIAPPSERATQLIREVRDRTPASQLEELSATYAELATEHERCKVVPGTRWRDGTVFHVDDTTSTALIAGQPFCPTCAMEDDADYWRSVLDAARQVVPAGWLLWYERYFGDQLLLHAMEYEIIGFDDAPSETKVPQGPRGDALGDGRENTRRIIEEMSMCTFHVETNDADLLGWTGLVTRKFRAPVMTLAGLCARRKKDAGGDWFIPSHGELELALKVLTRDTASLRDTASWFSGRECSLCGRYRMKAWRFLASSFRSRDGRPEMRVIDWIYNPPLRNSVESNDSVGGGDHLTRGRQPIGEGYFKARVIPVRATGVERWSV